MTLFQNPQSLLYLFIGCLASLRTFPAFCGTCANFATSFLHANNAHGDGELACRQGVECIAAPLGKKLASRRPADLSVFLFSPLACNTDFPLQANLRSENCWKIRLLHCMIFHVIFSLGKEVQLLTKTIHQTRSDFLLKIAGFHPGRC